MVKVPPSDHNSLPRGKKLLVVFIIIDFFFLLFYIKGLWWLDEGGTLVTVTKVQCFLKSTYFWCTTGGCSFGCSFGWQPHKSPGCPWIDPWVCRSYHVCGISFHSVGFLFLLVWAFLGPSLLSWSEKKKKNSI